MADRGRPKLQPKRIKLTDAGRKILGVDRTPTPRDTTPIKGAVVPPTKAQRARTKKRRKAAAASRRRNRHNRR